MKKQNLLILSGIIAITLASCGGSSETEKPKDTQEDSVENAEGMKGENNGATDEDREEGANDSSSSREEGVDNSPTDNDWDEILDGYEEYVDDYITLIKKQKADPADMSIMTEVQSLMQKGQEWSTKMSEISSEFGVEQLARMQEIQGKIAKAAY